MPVKLYATPDAIRVITSPARRKGLFAGRRWGKTLGVIVPLIIMTALSKSGARICYIAPSHKLTKFMFRLFLDRIRPLIKRSDAQFPFVLELWNGSVIEFYSFKTPASIRGSGYDLVVFDEIQEVRDSETFDAVIVPLLSDRSGSLLVAGQFRGKNWYYENYCVKGGLDYVNDQWTRVPMRANTEAFVFPASTGPTYQTAKKKRELLEDKETLPRVIFEQEYECIPTANQHAVFKGSDLIAIRRGQVLKGPRRNPETGLPCHYICAYDLGEMIDPSALVVLEYETMTIVHAELIPLRVPHATQAHNLAIAARHWSASVIIDGTAGGSGGKYASEENIKFYREHIPDVHVYIWQAGFKTEMVKHLSLLIEQHKISIPEALPEVHRELQNYEFIAKPEGRYDYQGPNGKGDNLVAGVLMACYAAKRGQIKDPGGRPLSSLMY